MRTWLPIVFGVALAGCGRESSPTASAAAATAPPPTATTAAAPAAHLAAMARLDALADTAEPADATAMRTIGGRLQHESAHRPDVGVRAEDVLAALAAAGVPVAEPRQYVAMTVRAAYCVGGQTADGLGVAVCEYPTAAAAAAGRAYVAARYPLPDVARAIHVRGSTTLALSAAKDHPLEASRRRAEHAFETM